MSCLIIAPKDVGIHSANGNEILGMDFFDSAKAKRKIWPRLPKSYLRETAARDKQNKPLKTAVKDSPKALPPFSSSARRQEFP